MSPNPNLPEDEPAPKASGGGDRAANSATSAASPQSAAVDWSRVAEMSEFKQLMAAKRQFIVPATVFFVVYYFALPVLVGYAPEFMSKPVLGKVNLAYLFALSQFFVAWLLAWLYVRRAAQFDAMAEAIKAKALAASPEN